MMSRSCVNKINIFRLLLLSTKFISVCWSSSDHVTKDVIVVGGGIAGLAAARKLINHPSGQYRVIVVEARKHRYGGRIWTDRFKMKKAKGVEADLGAMWINSRVQDNPILKLVRSAELDIKPAGPLQLHVPFQNKVYMGDKAKKIFTEVYSIMQSGVDKVKKSGKDRSLMKTIEEELSDYKFHGDQSVVTSILRSHHATTVHDHSTLHFDPVKQFGWDSTVPDGFDNIADIIVGGLDQEAVIPVELNKPVRQVKVDSDKKKVLVRAEDLKQLEADHVIIALPLGVLQTEDKVLFDPPLPRELRQAISEIGIRKNNKVIVGFDEVFWPKDVGTFTMATEKSDDWGFLQTWVNLDHLVGAPFLMGILHGNAAERVEKMKDSELKSKVLENLAVFFGEEVLNKNITEMLRSHWQTEKYTLGGGTYARVGNSASLWKTLQKPICPYIYFAGGYTDIDNGLDCAHSAYLSGVRAAEQIISKTCNKLEKKGKSDTNGGSSEKKKLSKDEL